MAKVNASKLIDQQFAKYNDWRGKLMKDLRKIILSADSEIEEEWKWGVGVWVRDGMVCAVSAFKDHVKMNFFKGASLKDPGKLLNSGKDSKLHRAIDFSEGDKLNPAALKKLIKEAISKNSSKK